MPVSQKVQIDTYDYGSSLTVPTVNALADDAQVGDAADTCNELTVDSGIYVADFIGANEAALIPAGTYRLKTSVGGLSLKWFVTFAGVDGEVVYAREERAAELDPATRVKLDASQPDYDLPTNTELNAAIAASQLVITTDTADIPRYGDLQRFDQSANNSGNKTADVTITKLS